jgi:hypothetical protein
MMLSKDQAPELSRRQRREAEKLAKRRPRRFGPGAAVPL